MAGISSPGVDLDVSWPLVAGIGILVAGIIYIFYELFQSSGASSAVQAASGVVKDTATLVQAPIQAVTNAVNTISGNDGSAGKTGSDSNLFYSGISNFFSTGSIYGDPTQ